jgi:hypothetical protein
MSVHTTGSKCPDACTWWLSSSYRAASETSFPVKPPIMRTGFVGYTTQLVVLYNVFVVPAGSAGRRRGSTPNANPA